MMLKDADRCCGSTGVYNIIESEMSMQILGTKMENVKTTMATTIVTANPGCLLQMKLGIEKEGLSHKIRAVQIVDLLLRSSRRNRFITLKHMGLSTCALSFQMCVIGIRKKIYL
jgi:glycolate oxidase iron-sulfur subunit